MGNTFASFADPGATTRLASEQGSPPNMERSSSHEPEYKNAATTATAPSTAPDAAAYYNKPDLCAFGAERLIEQCPVDLDEDITQACKFYLTAMHAICPGYQDSDKVGFPGDDDDDEGFRADCSRDLADLNLKPKIGEPNYRKPWKRCCNKNNGVAYSLTVNGQPDKTRLHCGQRFSSFKEGTCDYYGYNTNTDVCQGWKAQS